MKKLLLLKLFSLMLGVSRTTQTTVSHNSWGERRWPVTLSSFYRNQ